MSPAEVEIFHPAAKQSVLQSPNPNFTASAPNNHSQNQQSMNSSSSSSSSYTENATESAFGATFASQNGSQIESRMSGRARPRLVKVRKHLNSGRTRNASSGFNPFRQTGDSSGPVTNGTVNTLLSNGFSLGSLNSKKVDNGSGISNGNLGFVFGANGSDFAVNLNSGEREFGGNERKLGCDDKGRVGIENGSEPCRNCENMGFVFGAKQSDAEANLYWENRKFAENVEKSVCDDGVKMKTECEAEFVKFENAGFVFGANRSDAGVELKLEKREKGECASKLISSEGEKVELGTEAELVKESNIGFTFGANQSNSALNLNLENGESNERIEKKDSGGVDFVFGDRQSDLSSTSSIKENESRTVMDKSVLDFVFGASCFNLMSNSNLGKRESGGKSFGKPVCDIQEKIKVEGESESQNVKATAVNFSTNGNKGWDGGAFVFCSSGKKTSSINECMAPKHPNEMKANIKFFGDGYGIAKTRNSNLDSYFAEKCEVANQSHGDDLASASSSNPVFILPDEMKKLNINDFENVCGAGVTEDSNKFSCKTTFVFSSSKKVSSSSDENSEIPYDHASEHPTTASETTFKDYANITNMDHVALGNSCDIDSVPCGTSSSKTYNRFQPGLVKSSDSSQFSQGQVKDDMQKNRAAAPSSFSSFDLNFQQNGSVFTDPSIVGVEKKNESSSTSTPDGSGVPFTDFKTPQWDPSSFKANLFSEGSRKLEFIGRSRLPKDKKSKKMKGKLKQSSLHKQQQHQDYVQKESNTQAKPNSPEYCSPMDFSPYQETTAADQFSGETSVRSSPSSHLDNNCAPSTLHSGLPTDAKYEELAAIGKRYGISEGDQKCKETNEESSGCHRGWFFSDDCPLGGFVSGAEMSSSCADVASDNDGDAFGKQKQESNCRVQFCFASGLEDGKSFTFSASSSAQGRLSLRKRQLRKKSRSKAFNNSLKTTPGQNTKASSSAVPSSPCSSLSSLLYAAEDQEEDKLTSQSKAGNKSEVAERVKQGSTSSYVIPEACEMWRLRGNQAYKNRNMPKAEDYYTQGINSIPSSENLECCVKPLVLCYSNRAATRISLGRMREAIGDCVMAAALDPNFLKVYMRAANCHLVLGEVENALQYFNKCLESRSDVCLDRITTIEAADGLQKAQRVVECINHAAKLLEQKTSDAALSALEIIAEALSISSCSEKLLHMKAEALCMLRRYEEVINLCEKSLHVAEKNFASVGTVNQLSTVDGFECENYSLEKLWRWHLKSKSYFYMGKLEVALDLLQKLEQLGSIRDKHGSFILESSISLAATIRELLRCKNAGNEAVRSGRYTEAIEQYTVTLSINVESWPFTAICFCNRAAAHQALGQIADAIADCSLSMALDGNYAKAVSRRAKLHEMIRDYGQAASDLQRLIYILENQSDKKAKPSGTPGGTVSSIKELRQAHRQLSAMQEAAKRGIPLDLYLILGIKASDTTSDIKKAYRKAALRHHPDKAGQFLVRSESGDEGRLWKEISQEVHKDADRLFKMIGEAYAVLSDTSERSQYDLEEEVRKAKASMESDRCSPCRTPSDVHNYPFERSTNRRNWRENR